MGVEMQEYILGYVKEKEQRALKKQGIREWTGYWWSYNMGGRHVVCFPTRTPISFECGRTENDGFFSRLYWPLTIDGTQSKGAWSKRQSALCRLGYISSCAH